MGSPRVFSCRFSRKGLYRHLTHWLSHQRLLLVAVIGVSFYHGWKVAGDRAENGPGRPCWSGYRKKAFERNSCRAAAKAGSVVKPVVPLKRPTLTFVAGANGSGKTTLTRWNSGPFRKIPVLDPDMIGKTLQATATSAFPVAGARQVLKSANEHLRTSKSFAIETTLAGKNYLRMMLEARTAGFEIVLVYIGTENVEINLSRIRNRVLAGGHDVPEEDVRRRYLRSFKNLPIAIKRADHTILFDNSREEGYRLIAILSSTENQWLDAPPGWASALRL